MIDVVAGTRVRWSQVKFVVEKLTGRSGSLCVAILCHNNRYDLTPEDAIKLADELVDAAEAATAAIQAKETLNDH